MTKIKIAIYTTTFPPKLGGIATSNYNIYNLLKTYYDMRLFVYNDTENQNDENVIHSNAPKWIVDFITWVAAIYLKKYDKNEPFKVTKSIIRFAVKIFFLNKALRKFEPDIILIADNGVPAYGLIKPKKSKLIWFARNNYSRFKNQVLCSTIAPLDLQLAWSMERNAIKKADVIVSPSYYMVEVTKAAHDISAPIYVVNNIIIKDLILSIGTKDLFNLLQMPNHYPLVYIPSAGSSIKGKRYVYEIVRQLIKHANNNIGFFLSGPIPQDLAFELALLDKAHIYSPGHVDWQDNIALMKSCTLCITPNIIENYSNAILEAQTLQLPVVAFDTGGNSEIVKHNRTGYIVPYLDIDALIAKSKSLLEDIDTLKLFRDNCRDNIDKIANKDVIFNKYQDIFKEILE